MLGGFQVMTLQELITNKIINPIKSMGKTFSSYKPKDSTAAGSLISLIGILAPILLSNIKLRLQRAKRNVIQK